MTQSIDDRLTTLEVKATFTEDLVDKLEQIVTQQQRVIDRLLKHTRELGKRMQEIEPTSPGGTARERPPHY